MPKQFLSINEAAARLGVSTKTLRRWEEKGILSPKRTIGNQRRYSLADLQKAEKQSLSINEAAERLGLSAKTLRRWEAKGILNPQRTSGNQRRYAVSDIEILKDKSPKEILSKKVTKQAASDLLSLEKERFFDIASVKKTPRTNNRPVVADFNPVVSSPSSLAESNEISNQRPSDFIEFTPGNTNKHFLTKRPLQWGFAFSSLVAVLLVLATASKMSDHALLLSFLPYLNKTKDIKISSDEQVLQAATQKRDYTFKISVPAEFMKTASVAGKLTAPNIVYSVIAGNNVTVTGDPQNPTISTDLAILPGDGITIAPDGTVTNDDPGSAQNIFKNIKVGSDTISAGNNTDTFELAAGSNITLTTDTGSKKITIAGPGSTGISGILVEEGDTEVANSATTLDFLAGDFDVGESPTGEANLQLAATLTSVTGVAGSFAVGTSLDVGTNLHVTGNTDLDGTLTLGSDTINDLTGVGLTVSGSTLQVNLSTLGGAGSTSSNSGLEVGANGLSLLKGCADSEILKWDDTNTIWQCATDSGGGGGGGGVTTIQTNDVNIGTSVDTLDFSTLLSLTASPANEINITIAADALNFTELSDSLTLDAATTITNALLGSDLTIDLTSTGDFVIADNSTPFFTFTDTGALTQAGSGQVTFSGNVDANSGLDVTGNLTVSGTTTFGGIAYTWPGTESGGQILQTDGLGTLSWVDPGSLPTSDDWDSINGSLVPKITTQDLLIGGVATNSAKFAVLNVAGGIPTASLSAGLAGGSYLTANGTLQTTAFQSLALGGDSTGNISISPRNGSGLLGLNVGSLTINGSTGATSASPTCVSVTNGIVTGLGGCGAGAGGSVWTLNTTNGTLYPINSTVDVLFGGVSTQSAKFAFTGVAGGTPTASISAITTNNALTLDANGTIGTTNEQTLSLGTASTGDINIILGGSNNLRINGTPGATVGTASCVTTTNGIVTGTNTCPSSLASFIWQTGNGTIFEGNTTQDLLIGGTATESAKFAVLNVNNGTPTASVSAGITGAAFLSANGSVQTTARQTLNLGGGNTGNIVLDAGSGLITLSDPTSLSSSLDVAGTATFNGLLDANGQVDLGDGGDSFSLNSNNIDISGGAISGATGIASSGTITFSAFTSNGGVLYTNGSGQLAQATAGGANTVLHGGTTPSFSAVDLTADVTGILAITNGGSPFEQSQGAIIERITTQDLLLGSTATSSARFAVTNIAGGTPIASLSAGVAGGAYLTADGTFQTTAFQSLAIGGGSTGNISISPKAGSGNLSLNLAGLTVNGSTGVTTGSPTCVSVTNGIVTGTGGCGAGAGGSVWTLNTTNGTLYPINNTLDLLIGGVSTASAKFAVLNVAGGTPTASVAGTTGSIFLTATGGVQTTAKQSLALGGGNTGDINFTIGGSNNLRINGTAGATVPAATCVTTLNGIVTGTGSCDTPLSSFLWSSNLGAIVEGNTTMDLLIGGLASDSARFHVFGSAALAGTTPVASVSGNTSSAGLIADNRIGDLFAASSSGLNRFVIKQNGNVGIGTSLPSTNLEVSGTGNRTFRITSTDGNDAILDFFRTGSGFGDWRIQNNLGTLLFRTSTDDLATVTTRMIMNSDGGIHIGTGPVLPEATLEIEGVYGTQAVASASGRTSFAALVADNSLGDLFAASSSGQNRFVIAQNGRVGIGVTVPGALLDVNGSPVISTDNRFQLGITDNTSAATGVGGGIGFGGYYNGTSQVADLAGIRGIKENNTAGNYASAMLFITRVFGGGPTERMRISSEGNLAIGTTSPLATLDVRGNPYSGGTLPIASLSAKTSFAGLVVDNSGSGDLFTASYAGQTRFYIANNGGTGIGTNDTVAGNLSLFGPGAGDAEGAQINLFMGADWDTTSDTWAIDVYEDDFRIITAGAEYFRINNDGTINLKSSAYNCTGFANGGALTADANGLISCSTDDGGAGGGDITAVGSMTSGAAFADATADDQWLGLGATAGRIEFDDQSTDEINFLGANVGIGTSTPDTVLQITGGTDASVSNGSGYLVLGTVAGTNIVIDDNEIMARINGAISDLLLQNDGGDVILANNTNTGRLGINAGLTPAGTLDVRGNFTDGGTTPIATFSGKTSFAGLIVDNKGSGDLFTASYSGATRFTINNRGDVYIRPTTGGSPGLVVYQDSHAAASEPFGDFQGNGQFWVAGATNTDKRLALGVDTTTSPMIGVIQAIEAGILGRELVLNPSGGNVGIGNFDPSTALDVTGVINSSSDVTVAGVSLCRSNGTNCPSGNTQYWTMINGALSPGGSANPSVDLVVGGVSTASATFHVYGSNRAGTNPVASVSANTSFAAMVIDNKGIGDLFTASRGGQTMFTIGKDRVQIGTGSATGAGGAETPQLLALDSKGSTGDPAGGRQGDMYYNTVDEKFRCYQGTGWKDCIATSASEYMMAVRVGAQRSPELDLGDHIYFNTASASAGSSISLNSGTYGNGGGQFTLQAGRTYRLSALVPYAEFSTADSNFTYTWVNVNTGLRFGTEGGVPSTNANFASGLNGTAEAVITPSVTTVVEVRIVGGSNFTALGETGGGMLYPNAYIETISGAQELSASEYLRAEINTTQNTAGEIDDNDHIKFDTVQAFSGSSISLDTSTTPYVEGGSGANIGRFTLKAGKTYRLEGQIFTVFGSAASQVTYQWYDATNSTYIGSGAYENPTNRDDVTGMGNNAEAIITPTTNIRVELRIVVVGTGSLASIGTTSSGTSAFIEVLSDGTQVAQFTGATSAADGAIGYVPAPLAGQQGSLLLGNGTWTAANYFKVGTDLTSPIASLAARTSFAGLFVDNSLGDLFSASASGVARFSIQQNGTIVTNGVAGVTNAVASCVTTTNGIVTGTNTCPAGSGGSNWTLDTTLGILRPNNGTVDLLIGGASSSSATFHLFGATKNQGTTPVASVSANTSNAGLIADNRIGDLFAASSSGLNRFVIKNNGQVGIGTAVPSANRDLEIASGNTSTYLKFNPTTNEDWTLGADGFGLSFINDTDGATRMTLDENGNVGIGATDPTLGTFSRGLEIADSGTGPALALNATSGKKFIIGSADSPAGLYFRDDTAGAYRMVIDTNGRIGINTGVTPVLSTFDVRGTTSHLSAASISANTSFAALITDNSGRGDLFTASNAGFTRFRIRENGGITSIAQGLDANANTNQFDAYVTKSSGLATGTSFRTFAAQTSGASSVSLFGHYNNLEYDTTSSTNHTGDLIASLNQINWRGTGTSTTGRLIGQVGKVVTYSGSGAVENAIGFLAEGSFDGATVTNSYDMRINNPTGTATVTNAYGLYIENITKGATLNYPLYVAGGTSYFGGQVGIGATAPLATLDTRGLSGTTPAASISGKTSFATVVVDNQGSGDLFTASSSGQNRFVITQNGQVGIGTVPSPSAGYALHIASPDQSANILKLERTGSANPNIWNFTISSLAAAGIDAGSLILANGTTNADFAIRSTNINLYTAIFDNNSRSLSIPNGMGTVATASISGATSFASLLVDNSVGDLFTASASGLNRFVIKQNGNVGIGTSTPDTALQVDSNNIAAMHLRRINNGTGGSNIQFENGAGYLWEAGAAGSATSAFTIIDRTVSGGPTRLTIDTTGQVGINVGNDPRHTLDVLAVNGTDHIASFAGTISRAGILVDNSGIGDIFTASSSGLSRFTIKQNGTIQLATPEYTTCGLLTTSSGLLTCSSLPAGNTNYWQIVNAGTITPYITNVDTLFGGVSTASATFRITGGNKFAGTQTAASISANTSFAAMVIDNKGRGDLFTASSSGLTRFVIAQNGNVGIGTALPTEKLHVFNNADSATTIRLENTNTGANAFAEMNFVTSADRYGLGIAGSGTGTGAGNFYLWDYTASNYRFVVDDLGKFGIGDNKDPIATLDVRATTPTYSIASISGATNTGWAALVVDNSGSGDIFTASTSGQSKFRITNAGNVSITSGGLFVSGGSLPSSISRFTPAAGSPQSALQVGLTSNSTTVNSGPSLLFFADDSTAQSEFLGRLSAVFENGTNGSERAALSFAVRGNSADTNANTEILRLSASATTPIATFSGTTNFAGLVVDNAGRGDLFTASSSGLNRFVIKQDGRVMIGTNSAVSDEMLTSVRNTEGYTGNFTSVGGFGGITINAINSASSVIGRKWGLASMNSYFGRNDFEILEYTDTFNDGVYENADTRLSVRSGGRVGIGTTFASAGLEVQGTQITNGGTSPIASFSARTTSGGLVVDNNLGDIFAASSSGLNRFVINNNGNIGIGTALPAAKLEIAGTNSSANGLKISSSVNSNSLTSYMDSNGIAHIDTNGTTLDLNYVTGQNVVVGGAAAFGGADAVLQTYGSHIYFRNNDSANALTLYDVGSNIRFNIGTTATVPVASVGAQTTFAAMIVDNTGRGDIFTASSSGLTRFVVQQNGNVSIGSATGSGRLNIIPLTDDLTLQDGLHVADHTQSGYLFADYKSTGTAIPYGEIGAWSNSLNAHQNLVLGHPGSPTKVGILNSSPTTALDVTGVINASSNVTVNGVSVCLTSGNCAGLSQFWTMTNNAISPSGTANPTVDLVLGGVSTASATFHVYGSSRGGTNPVASIAANTSNAGLVVDNRASGDLFTASSAGLTRFTVAQNGNVRIGNALDLNTGLIPSSKLEIVSEIHDALLDVGTTANYHLTLWDTSGVGGAGPGMAFVNSADVNNIGGAINFNRTGAFSQGRLQFYTKSSVLNGDDPQLAFTLDVAGATASVSGTSGFAALVTDNKVGDLFTASSSGLNRFVIKQNGNIGIGNLSAATIASDAHVHIVDTANAVTAGVGNVSIFLQGNTNTDGTGVGIGFAESTSNLNLGAKIVHVRTGAQSTGDLAFYTKNSASLGDVTTEKLRITSGGMVGINTTSPLGTLDVRGNPTNGGTIAVASISGRTSFAALGVDNTLGVGDIFTASSSGLNRFVIRNNGNVGIGTPLPTDTLHLSSASTLGISITNTTGGVTGRIYNDGNLHVDGATNNLWLSGTNIYLLTSTNNNVGINTSSARAYLDIRGNGVFGNSSVDGTIAVASISGKTSFSTLVVDNSGGRGDIFSASASGRPRFTIANNGNVTIGTSSALVGDQGISIYSQNNSFLNLFGDTDNNAGENGTSYIKLVQDAAFASPRYIGTIQGTDENPEGGTFTDTVANALLIGNSGTDNLQFGTNNAVVMTINGSGEVGIGTNAPSGYILDVEQSDSSGLVGSFYNTSNSNNADVLGLQIAYTSNPTTSNNYISFFDSGFVTIGEIEGDGAGGVRFTGDAAGTFSDRRLKENIEPYNGDAIDFLKKFNPVTFNYKAGTNPGLNRYGFIAQDVLKIFPQAINFGDDLSGIAEEDLPTLRMDYSALTPLLVKGVQEQQGQLDGLKQQVTNMIAGSLDTNSLSVQQFTLAGENVNTKLAGLDQSASVSATLGTQIAQLQTNMESLTNRVASLEAALELATNNPIGSFNASSSADLSLDNLEVNGNTQTDTLSVLGYATMNELSVTGSIRTGVLTIKGQVNGGASISTLNGDLKLQDQGFGGIDILDGMMTIDTSGNVQTQGEVIAKKFNVDTTNTLSASAGTGTVPAGAKTTIINTSAVTADSIIQITFTSDYFPATRYWIKAKSAGNSFTLELNQPVNANSKFSWWIIN